MKNASLYGNEISPPPPCLLCGGNEWKIRSGKVRDNAHLRILECVSCGLVRLSSFDHIDDSFYQDSGMHKSSEINKLTLDVVAWLKDSESEDSKRFERYKEMIRNKDILDFGCGAGGFLLKARDIATTVYGIELENKLRSHFQQNKLRVCHDLDDYDTRADYIFMFHVLEHIKDPFGLLDKLKQKLKPDGKIIIEVPSADDALFTLYQSKAFSEFTYWSPHLYLYNSNTLAMLAKKAGLTILAIRQEQRYPLSNHLYWLSHGLPGGHSQWTFLNTPELESAYESALAALGKCDTIVGYFCL